MSREQRSNSRSLRVHEIEGVLRYPDGSVDIAAYAKLAHRERAAAIAASAGEAIRMVRGMLWAIGVRLASVSRSGPASGKHHAPVGR
jgi:hypothetical protein